MPDASLTFGAGKSNRGVTLHYHSNSPRKNYIFQQFNLQITITIQIARFNPFETAQKPKQQRFFSNFPQLLVNLRHFCIFLKILKIFRENFSFWRQYFARKRRKKQFLVEKNSFFHNFYTLLQFFIFVKNAKFSILINGKFYTY